MSATMTGGKTGTASASTSCVVTSVSAEAGDTIVLYVHLSVVSGALSATPDWGGTPFSDNPIDQLTGLSDGETYIFFLPEIPVSGTHDVTIPFSIALNAAAAVEVWRGIKQTPQDQLTSTNGSSTSPSSGATAATTQAAELVLGVVGTNGPSGDTAGTWSNSFTASQRAGTTGGIAGNNRTVATGYKIVSATGAQTAAKTGITSRSWTAGVVTFKLASEVSVSLPLVTAASASPSETTGLGTITVANPLASAATASPAPTAALGDITQALPLATAATAALVPTRTLGGISAALPLATIASASPTLNEDEEFALATVTARTRALDFESVINYFGTDANGFLDPSETLTDGAASIAQSRGIRSFGLPYFAMWMQNPAGFVDFRYPIVASLLVNGGFTVLAAINAPPTQISSVDEVHFFASYHEIGGIELFSLGVTPNMRLALKTSDGPILYSAPGIVIADGVARSYYVSTIQDSHFGTGYRSRMLMVDDLIVAQDTRSGTISYIDGNVSPTGKPTRMMIFNGVEGRTLLDCTIFALRNRAVLWPMTPIVGITTPGYESTGGIGDPIVAPDTLTYPTSDFTLSAGFFDPRPFYALAAGDIPAQNSQGFQRALNTQYRRRVPASPNYRLVGSA